jgi:hypothetical protein
MESRPLPIAAGSTAKSPRFLADQGSIAGAPGDSVEVFGDIDIHHPAYPLFHEPTRKS